MISFKSFISAVHEAIVQANETLMEKNEALLDRYFDRKFSSITRETELVPKTVTLTYPETHSFAEATDKDIKEDYVVEVAPITVPLITIVPLSMNKIEKATLTAEFDIELVDDEVQLNFVTKKRSRLFGKSSQATHSKLEIVLSPEESSEGLRLLVEGYEDFLRKQIS
ncbi:MAG: DUF2589 domain-containing protein [Aureispira sp.]